MRNRLHLAAMTATLGLVGCAPVASQLSEASVESTVGTISEEENLRRIDRISASPEFQHSLERVSASLVRGVIDGVGDAESLDVDMKEVGDAARDLGRELGRGLGQGLIAGMGGAPDPGALIDDAITGALTSATTDQNRERARLLASEAEHALGGMVREVSRQATLGFDAGMEDIRESNRAEREGILGRSATVGWGVALAGLGAALLAAIIIIIIALAVANGRRRKERERMLTTMWIAFAGQGNGLDEATRAELLRQLGISPSLSGDREKKAST